jgi:hypothetical protein
MFSMTMTALMDSKVTLPNNANSSGTYVLPMIDWHQSTLDEAKPSIYHQICAPKAIFSRIPVETSAIVA